MDGLKIDSKTRVVSNSEQTTLLEMIFKRSTVKRLRTLERTVEELKQEIEALKRGNGEK